MLFSLQFLAGFSDIIIGFSKLIKIQEHILEILSIFLFITQFSHYSAFGNLFLHTLMKHTSIFIFIDHYMVSCTKYVKSIFHSKSNAGCNTSLFLNILTFLKLMQTYLKRGDFWRLVAVNFYWFALLTTLRPCKKSQKFLS